MGAPDLFARQRALAEIGERGQARLLVSRFAPSANLPQRARAYGTRYALAAGFGDIGEPSEGRATPLAVHFRHSAARDVGLGAADVLNQALPHFALSRSDLPSPILPTSDRQTSGAPQLDVPHLEK